ncbi:MAG: bifunctional adenosylcobinamide kinase/adenosylcobinamide-phosphate guanylyltransferase [Mariprofundales bacterium]
MLGAARSGKSSFAEAQAQQHSVLHNRPVIYIATACPIEGDDAWRQRIDIHRQRRPSSWQTIEVPYALPEAIQTHASSGALLLVDCLTVWLSNIMLGNHDLPQAQALLCQVIENIGCDIILVSNEVGMGVVPEHALGRQFCDAQGRLNQAVAASCDRVEMIIAGLPLRLKG